MFSLIISLIAVVLVVILSIAAFSYLSNPSKDAVAKTQAAQYLQEGGQIVGSLEIYKAHNVGALPGGDSDTIIDTLLTQRYLKSWPEERWGFTSEYLIREEVHENACKVINKNLGIGDIIPSCDAEEYLSRSVCCTNEPVTP